MIKDTNNSIIPITLDKSKGKRKDEEKDGKIWLKTLIIT